MLQEERGSGMIYFTSKGKWGKTANFLQRALNRVHLSKLDKYAQMGVEALEEHTPVLTGRTARSWSYEIIMEPDEARIIWKNSNVVDDWCNVALIVQHGHVGRDGKWVEGVDYINPALVPIFNDISDLVWKEVVSDD